MSSHSLQEMLEKMAQLHIVVAGDFMLDRYLWGSVHRISPEAPVPVVEVRDEAERPGGAGNVVLNLASLGARCTAVGLVGGDAHGERLRALMEAERGDGQGLVVAAERATTVKTRILADDQQLVRVDREIADPISPELEQRVLEQLLAALADADGLILQDYNKGVLTPRVIEEAIGAARQRNLLVAVDPKLRNFFSYRGATLVKPNLREAEGALGRPLERERDILEGGAELLERLEAEQVLLTRGGAGMSLFERGEPARHIPARARSISDVSGAGDTVIATMTLALAAGSPAREAAQLATRAAGYVVGRVGVVPVTPEALLGESQD